MHKKKKNKKRANHPRDHQAVALESLKVITNEERPDDEVRKSYDETNRD